MFIFASTSAVALPQSRKKNAKVTDTTHRRNNRRKGSLANCGRSGMATQAVVIVPNCGENGALRGESQA